MFLRCEIINCIFIIVLEFWITFYRLTVSRECNRIITIDDNSIAVEVIKIFVLIFLCMNCRRSKQQHNHTYKCSCFQQNLFHNFLIFFAKKGCAESFGCRVRYSFSEMLSTQVEISEEISAYSDLPLVITFYRNIYSLY